jgi:acetyl esterase/lipase
VALERAGNRVSSWREPGLLHGFLHMAAVCPSASAALERIAAELRRDLNS